MALTHRDFLLSEGVALMFRALLSVSFCILLAGSPVADIKRLDLAKLLAKLLFDAHGALLS